MDRWGSYEDKYLSGVVRYARDLIFPNLEITYDVVKKEVVIIRDDRTIADVYTPEKLQDVQGWFVRHSRYIDKATAVVPETKAEYRFTQQLLEEVLAEQSVAAAARSQIAH